ncbi:hypothetical protein CMI37_07240 [Candidatus Pacearchaeota archaeon]|nr:hypothetical protein [Candidatus Pacearchaeota archaeon]
MSTRCTTAIFNNDDLNMHLYHEMHDGAYHLEVYVKVTDGEFKGENTNSCINIVVPLCMVEPLKQLMEPSDAQ